MGTINVRKLIVGGLIAGAVLSAIDVAMYGAILKKPMAVAWKDAGRPTMTEMQRNLEVPLSILSDFVVGLILIWMYAAIRSRFGPGPFTALKAGFAGWLLASALCAALSAQGVMPFSVMIITVLALLVEYPLAVVLAARFYSERA